METNIAHDHQIIEMIEEERKGAPAYRMKLKRTKTSSNVFGRAVAKHILNKPHHEHDHYADHFNVPLFALLMISII